MARIVELIERVERSTVEATSELIELLELTPRSVIGLCEADALDLCAAAGLVCTAMRRDDVSLTEPADEPELRRVWYEVDGGLVTRADYGGYAIPRR